jgi:DNA-binding GntR family transcriptional regulator
MTDGVSQEDVASLTERAYQAISRAIANLELKPGEALKQDRLAKWLSISRTPVREALRRLERDGLVKIVQGRGAFVADVTEREVRDIYLCREYLTGLAARLTAENLQPHHLAQFQSFVAEMAEAVQDADLPRFFRFNVKFGRLMNEVADNPTLSALSGSLGLRVMRLRYLSMGLPTRMETSLRKHQEIVAAFERRDPVAAELHLREVIRGACLAILRYHFGLNEQGRRVDLTEQISDLVAEGR